MQSTINVRRKIHNRFSPIQISLNIAWYTRRVYIINRYVPHIVFFHRRIGTIELLPGGDKVSLRLPSEHVILQSVLHFRVEETVQQRHGETLLIMMTFMTILMIFKLNEYSNNLLGGFFF